jgi:hypothetical protein
MLNNHLVVDIPNGLGHYGKHKPEEEPPPTGMVYINFQVLTKGLGLGTQVLAASGMKAPKKLGRGTGKHNVGYRLRDHTQQTHGVPRSMTFCHLHT